MTRKLAFLFDEGQKYHAVTQLIDEGCCRDHFAAGLNGVNGEAIAALLDKLVEGGLDNIKEDEALKKLWEAAQFKVDDLSPGAIACVMSGRRFTVDKRSGLPKATSKTVLTNKSMLDLKQALWRKVFDEHIYMSNQYEKGEQEKTTKGDSEEKKTVNNKQTVKKTQRKENRQRLN